MTQELNIGDRVYLRHEEESIVPEGWRTVTALSKHGGFRVGGNTIVWPSRVTEVQRK